ncbi:Alpha/Beta hydrolase protein [Kockiozyma suomiensis]|uniref:Alpha/Beta hydrolase protein n=1 Tax=Kockiozyma suomiensis TaxID=1337062 RepID=UPI003343D09A
MSVEEGMLTLANSGIKLAYKVISSSATTSLPVVMLSNSLSSSYDYIWNEFIKHFEDKYTIVLYDQRFHGKSPLADGFDYFGKGNSYADFTDDVIALIDHLQIARLHAFVGLSMGATTSICLKAKYPTRVGKVVAVSSALKSAPPPGPGQVDAFGERLEFARSNGMAALAPKTIERWFPGDEGQEFLKAHPSRAAELLEMLNKAPVEGLGAAIRAIQDFDLTASLEDIKTRGQGGEVLLVAGSLDGPVPKANQVMQIVGGTKLEIYDGTGHLVNIQQSAEFNQLVEKFIA